MLIDEGTATTVVHSGQRVAVEEHGYLLVTAVAEHAQSVDGVETGVTTRSVHIGKPIGGEA